MQHTAPLRTTHTICRTTSLLTRQFSCSSLHLLRPTFSRRFASTPSVFLTSFLSTSRRSSQKDGLNKGVQVMEEGLSKATSGFSMPELHSERAVV